MPQVNKTALDWNVVIAGAWNTAILTPKGIAKRLFQLEDTPVEVLVELEFRSPIRVKYQNIVVQPSSSSLIISPENSNSELLEQSVIIARRALEALPETPLKAAGLNIRYQYQNIPDELIEAGKSTIDDALQDAGFNINEKHLGRKIPWDEGVLNLDIHEREDASALILFNFHKASTTPGELMEWLGMHERMLEDSEKICDSLVQG